MVIVRPLQDLKAVGGGVVKGGVGFNCICIISSRINFFVSKTNSKKKIILLMLQKSSEVLTTCRK